MLSAQARLRRQRLGEKNPPPTCCSSVHLTWMSALGCGQLGIAHLIGNLHATAQINLSCEFHESEAQYDRFMDVGLGLKFIPS